MAGIHIIDITNPYDPAYVTTIEMHQASDIVLNGTTLFAKSSFDGLYSYNVSDPSNPVLLTQEFPILFESDLKIANDLLLASSGKNEIYDISDPVNITLISEIKTGENNYDVTVSGNYAYIAQEYSGMTIVDITNPLSPQIVSNYSIIGRAHEVKIIDNLAYLTSSSGLDIIDISDPMNPLKVGQYIDSDTTSSEEFTIINDIAYITAFPYCMDIVDVSNPAAPNLIASYTPSGVTRWDTKIENVNAFGNFAYVSSWQTYEIYIVDISNPAEPVEVGIYSDLQMPCKTSFIDGYALASGGIETVVLDISDPANPTTITRFQDHSQYEPAIYNDFLIFPGDMNSSIVTVYNIQDIAKPYFVGEFSTPGISNSIVPFGEYVIVADSYALLVMSLSLPTYLSGDANNDRSVNLGDAVYLINTVFKQGPLLNRLKPVIQIAMATSMSEMPFI
ncbi:MAG: hypothetical protein ABIE07_11675 [Candidatus Zixiibacteriota bacterium]